MAVTRAPLIAPDSALAPRAIRKGVRITLRPSAGGSSPRLWCKLSGSMQRNAREHYAAYAARTAFQISGAVLPLMRSFPSVN